LKRRCEREVGTLSIACSSQRAGLSQSTSSKLKKPTFLAAISFEERSSSVHYSPEWNRDLSLGDEWSEYANEYYSNSGQSVDDVIDTRLAIGLELTDSHHLEYLSDTRVLEALPGGFRYLEKGNREDAALYMRTRSALLELESFGAVRNQPERCVP